MSIRILQHVIFWLLFISLYVTMKMFFAESSDLAYPFLQRVFRFFIAELAFLPWKIIPFYFLFYFLIPRYFRKAAIFKNGIVIYRYIDHLHFWLSFDVDSRFEWVVWRTSRL